MNLKKKPLTGNKTVYKIVWDVQAKQSLKELYNYYKQKSKQGATNVKNDILQAAKNIVPFPEKFSYDLDLGDPYHRVVVRQYKIIYLVNEQELLIRIEAENTKFKKNHSLFTLYALIKERQSSDKKNKKIKK